MNFIFSTSVVKEPYRLASSLLRLRGKAAISLSNTLFSWMALTAMRHPVAPKYFENEYTQMVLNGKSANRLLNPGTKVP
jgi:hypothetical protein